MAIYKIFASSDATIYSKYPQQNTGLDEILEVSAKNAISPSEVSTLDASTGDDLRRSLVQFSDSDLAKIKTFATGSWKSYLRLYLANAENLSTQYDIEIRQVSQSWTMGTGKLTDSPETKNGVCWYSTSSYLTPTSSWAAGGYYQLPGGGSWSGSFATQSFGYADDKDINADVTSMVNLWFSGSRPNYGFILKHSSSVENNPNSYISLNYFSVDTHTIYPPTLEMRWDDSSYITGSLNVINSSNTIITIANNLDTFKYGTEKYRFAINARDKYPTRTFTTSSLYTTNKALPQTSYWAIQDAKTEDMVINFDTNYTKISCDGSNSYFNVYMNGLEPERYYKVLIRTVLSDGQTIDIDNGLIFKIVR
jgi:hypothetical protein